MKKIVPSIVAVFLFTFVYDFIVHGVLLTEAYEQTSSLWRPQEEYKMEFMALRQILLSILFVGFYCKAKPLCPMMFGSFVGAVLAAVELGKFSYMPIPFSLALSWAGAAIVYGLGVGGVLAAMSKFCKGDSCKATDQ